MIPLVPLDVIDIVVSFVPLTTGYIGNDKSIGL
jgi:hypothetical protein